MSETPAKHLSLSVLPNSGKADQLKREFAANPPTLSARPDMTPKTGLEGKIIAALRTIFDPELPLNIYELGLIYAIEIDPDQRVKLTMTLTSPGCPVAGMLVEEVQRKVQAIDEVKSATVNLVWEPAWSKDRLSEAALLELGLL